LILLTRDLGIMTGGDSGVVIAIAPFVEAFLLLIVAPLLLQATHRPMPAVAEPWCQIA